MKKSTFAAFLTACVALGTYAPAFAADDNAGVKESVDAALVPARVAGAGAGLVFGIPVAVCKETMKSYLSLTTGASDKIGGHASGPACVVASVVTIPAAIVVGSAKGVYYGTKNGMVHGFNEPFNPESFSLNEVESEKKALTALSLCHQIR